MRSALFLLSISLAPLSYAQTPIVAECSQPRNIDVLLLYSGFDFPVNDALEQLDDSGYVAVDERSTNRIFANSGIDVNLSVVGTADVSGHDGFHQNKADLINAFVAADEWQDIRDLRSMLRADLVLLALETEPDGTCGIAFLGDATDPTGDAWQYGYGYFNVTPVCVKKNNAAHEIGHLLGAKHEIGPGIGQQPAPSAPFPFSHGLILGAPNGVQNVTVMAVGDPICGPADVTGCPTGTNQTSHSTQCQTGGPTECTHDPRFSNPSIGTGTVNADNAKAICLAAPLVSQYDSQLPVSQSYAAVLTVVVSYLLN